MVSFTYSTFQEALNRAAYGGKSTVSRGTATFLDLRIAQSRGVNDLYSSSILVSELKVSLVTDRGHSGAGKVMKFP